jgi:hypothetical protein
VQAERNLNSYENARINGEPVFKVLARLSNGVPWELISGLDNAITELETLRPKIDEWRKEGKNLEYAKAYDDFMQVLNKTAAFARSGVLMPSDWRKFQQAERIFTSVEKKYISESAPTASNIQIGKFTSSVKFADLPQVVSTRFNNASAMYALGNIDFKQVDVDSNYRFDLTDKSYLQASDLFGLFNSSSSGLQRPRFDTVNLKNFRLARPGETTVRFEEFLKSDEDYAFDLTAPGLGPKDTGLFSLSSERSTFTDSPSSSYDLDPEYGRFTDDAPFEDDTSDEPWAERSPGNSPAYFSLVGSFAYQLFAGVVGALPEGSTLARVGGAIVGVLNMVDTLSNVSMAQNVLASPGGYSSLELDRARGITRSAPFDVLSSVGSIIGVFPGLEKVGAVIHGVGRTASYFVSGAPGSFVSGIGSGVGVVGTLIGGETGQLVGAVGSVIETVGRTAQAIGSATSAAAAASAFTSGILNIGAIAAN